MCGLTKTAGRGRSGELPTCVLIEPPHICPTGKPWCGGGANASTGLVWTRSMDQEARSASAAKQISWEIPPTYWPLSCMDRSACPPEPVLFAPARSAQAPGDTVNVDRLEWEAHSAPPLSTQEWPSGMVLNGDRRREPRAPAQQFSSL